MPSPRWEIGNVVVGERIGNGGFGVVYRCQHRYTGEELAIKLIDGRIPADRFFSEVRALARVRSERVVTIFDAGVTDVSGRPGYYYTMELADGALDCAQPCWCLASAVSTFRSVLTGLERIWLFDLVHKDVKPSNILRIDGWKIADFGLVGQAGSTGGMSGTPMYMSPEQARGETLDWRTDQYAFGLSLLHHIAGDRIFVAEYANPQSIIKRLPEDLARIISRLTSGRVHDRYRYPESIEDDLLAFESNNTPSSPHANFTRPRIINPFAPSEDGPRIRWMRPGDEPAKELAWKAKQDHEDADRKADRMVFERAQVPVQRKQSWLWPFARRE